MRNYLLLLAAVTSTAAMAQMPIQSIEQAEHNIGGQPIRPELKELLQTERQAKEAAKLSRADEAPITEAPGEELFFERSETGFYNSGGMIYWGTTNSGTKINKDGDDYYILNPFRRSLTKSYLKGSLQDDGRIKVELPQLLEMEDAWWADNTFYYYASLMEEYEYYSEDYGETMFDYRPVADEENVIYYIINEDGSVELDNSTFGGDVTVPEGEYYPAELPSQLLGMYYYSTNNPTIYWNSVADYAQSYSPFEGKANEIPEGVEMETWVLKDAQGTNRFITVGTDAEHIYLSNLNDRLPDACVIGDLNGSEATFKTAQYMGWLPSLSYFMWFLAGTAEHLYDNGLEEYIWYGYMADEVVMNYDPEAKTLSCRDENSAFIINSQRDYIYYFNFYVHPEMFCQTQEQMNAQPAQPYFYGYYDFTEYGDGLGLYWYIPNENVNGYILPWEDMYYEVYVNGGLMVFYEDEYPWDVVDEMTEVPCSYSGYDFYSSSNMVDFWLYSEGIEVVGLRSIYLNPDGDKFYSDMAEKVFISGIEGIENSQEVKDVYFTNMAGIRVANPQHGLYIKTSVLEDGTTINQKIMLHK